MYTIARVHNNHKYKLGRFYILPIVIDISAVFSHSFKKEAPQASTKKYK